MHSVESSIAGSRFRLTLAIALVSAAALAYQLLLMRWLAIMHWHPFAVMIISLALLGHGASGTWLSLWLRDRDVARDGPRFDAAFGACALAFAVSATLTPVVARAIPFNGLELVWNARQLLWLGALFLTLSVPFFFAAACFGLAFAFHGPRIPALYAADLCGAGVGALVALALGWWPLQNGLLAAAMCGVVAAMLVMRGRRPLIVAIAIGIALLALWPTRLLTPSPNEFKGLSKALLLPQARVLAERSAPHGWFTVLESRRVPLRHAPGQSLSYTGEPPPQLALYTDGDAMSVMLRDDGHVDARWLEAMTSALPYRMRTPDRVLVLGVGGGMEVLQALNLGARQVDAVEASAERLQWVRDVFAGYTGDLLRDRRVQAFHAEPRAFVRASPRTYDLIVLAGGESFASSGAGVQSASEQYALTVEALRDYLARLSPDGMIVATHWTKQPPRDELKFFATAVAALRERGAPDPARQLAAIRNWDASTWLIARSPMPRETVAALQRFAHRHDFDVVHAPGVRASAPQDRMHLLEPPYLFDGVQALLSPHARDYLRAYKFDIDPARDDRPYFGHFFRWHSLPELLRLRGQGGAVLLDSGYLLLVGALMLATALAVILVLLPLRALPRASDAGVSRERAGLYFIALGLAFLMIEIATLSRMTLLLGHPLLAANVALAGFLLCAGAGSAHAQRWLSRSDGSDAAIAARVAWAVRVIMFGLLWQFVVFVLLLEHAAAWPVTLRGLACLVGIAPLAFAMGIPFPLGLARLSRRAPAFVPWAWALNGCASVIAAILALLLAMALGLRTTLLIALALYVFAVWMWRGRVQMEEE